MSVFKDNYIVYKTTNLINNKIYIGVRKLQLEKDYLGSGNTLRKAIDKYGKINFKRETLFEFDSRELAYQKEKELVTHEFINRKDVYNEKVGGIGGSKKGRSSWCKGMTKDTDPRLKKLSESRSLAHKLHPQICSPDTRTKMSKRRAGKKGIRNILTNECKYFDIEIANKMISSGEYCEMNTGVVRGPVSEEGLENIRRGARNRDNTNVGKYKRTPEIIEKLKSTLKQNGKIPWNKGKMMSEEVRSKMRHPKDRNIIEKNKKACPHCHLKYDPGNYSKHHGDKCKKMVNI